MTSSCTKNLVNNLFCSSPLISKIKACCEYLCYPWHKLVLYSTFKCIFWTLKKKEKVHHYWVSGCSSTDHWVWSLWTDIEMVLLWSFTDRLSHSLARTSSGSCSTAAACFQWEFWLRVLTLISWSRYMLYQKGTAVILPAAVAWTCMCIKPVTTLYCKCHIGNKFRQFHPPLLLCVCSWQWHPSDQEQRAPWADWGACSPVWRSPETREQVPNKGTHQFNIYTVKKKKIIKNGPRCSNKIKWISLD